VNTLLTYNGRTGRLYVHVLEWPAGLLTLEGFAGRVEYAQLLHDASEVAFLEKDADPGFMVGPREKSPEKDLKLRLPVVQPDVEVPVIELFLKRP
jgi:alpha-L-fucosidase